MTVSGSMGGRAREGRRWTAFAGMLACAVLAGCHHRQAQPVLLPPQTPVALIEVPEPNTPPLVEAQSPKLPAVPTAQAAKPGRVKKRSPKKMQDAGVQGTVTTTTATAAGQAKKPGEIAGTAPKPDTSVVGIGALTVGGEQSPRAMQEASELAAANERRLNALSTDAVKAQADLVGKVRNFQREAQLALGSGDAEGAKTLATKGKLLLDDLEKGGSQ